MVRKTFDVLTAKIGGLREAAFWLSTFALFSQILALVRDRLLAHYFGAGIELDIYYAAFKIPDLIFVTVASLVSISALVPIFAKKETEGEKHLREATESIFTVFSVLIIFFCALAWFLMPSITAVSFSGLSELAKGKIIFLSRILLLSPLLLGFSNFFGSIVQYEKRFILYSLSPLLYNLGIIGGLLFLTKYFGITGAIIGVVAGAFLHLSLQGVFVFFSPMKPKFTSKIKWGDIWQTAYLSVPRTLALSVVSFVGFFFVVLAAGLGEGSIAIFNLSWNLQSAPLSLIGVSFSLAAFPALAVSAAKNDLEDVVEKISDGLRQIIFWSLPFAALIIVLRAHLVRVILGSGVFDWSATRLTAASLALFAVSTVFQSIALFLSRSHYALGKTKWPLVGNILGGTLSVFTALIFIKFPVDFTAMFEFLAEFLKVSDLPRQILFLPFAYSVGSVVTAVLLFLALGDGLTKEIWKKIRTSVSYGSIIAAVSGIGAYFTLWIFDGLFDLNTFTGVLGHGFISGFSGVALGAVTLYFIGNKEFKEIIGKFPK